MAEDQKQDAAQEQPQQSLVIHTQYIKDFF